MGGEAEGAREAFRNIDQGGGLEALVRSFVEAIKRPEGAGGEERG